MGSTYLLLELHVVLPLRLQVGLQLLHLALALCEGALQLCHLGPCVRGL